ncbi:ABC transporter substrate-binding protein [Mameliella sediminis]|uniref:ABC transporter substrate-binding protein n=1 Tax=Mameliella sediminis TaxID=2836866 RepID=UPI001C453BDC|nr:ABC transporter substrate-binding protein [Mameliella sediminis]MBV7396918.1 ABC transporter substrate-binding protein [Mameliella sediminis]
MTRLLLPNRRQFLAGGTALAASASLGMPALAQSGRPDVTIAVQALVDNFEPIQAISNVGLRVVNAMFDTLMYRDYLGNADGSGTQIQPAIATGIERLGPNRVRATIRDDVLFHNGERLTARDVAFSFGEDRMFGAEPMTPRAAYFRPDLVEVTARDDRTVDFVTAGPDYALEKRLASWIGWVVPEGPFRDMGLDGFGAAPIGTGPYKLKEFIRGDRIVLEANDDYYRGRPTARTITFVVVPEASTRAAGLISGEYDFACALSPDDIALLDRYDNVDARGATIENTHLIVHNQVDNILADKRIRKAMSLCVDRDALNTALWKGMAGVTNGFQIPSQGMAYDANRPAYGQHIETAKQLLSEAGYTGETITFRTLNDYYVNSVAAAQVMQQWWQEAGLNVELVIMENWGQVTGEGLMSRNWSNGFPLPDPVAPLTTDWGPTSNVQANYGWKAPEEFNSLLETIKVSPDSPERTAAFQRALDIFDDEAPGFPLYRPYELYGVRADINWRPVTFEWMELRPNNLSFG